MFNLIKRSHNLQINSLKMILKGLYKKLIFDKTYVFNLLVAYLRLIYLDGSHIYFNHRQIRHLELGYGKKTERFDFRFQNWIT